MFRFLSRCFSIEHIQREDNCETNQLAHHAVQLREIL